MNLVIFSLATLRLWAFGDACVLDPAGHPCFLAAAPAYVTVMCADSPEAQRALWIDHEDLMRLDCHRPGKPPAPHSRFAELYWDANRDGAFDLADVQRVLFAYFTGAGCQGEAWQVVPHRVHLAGAGCWEDFDRDGAVTLLDAQRVLFRWFTGQNCPDTGRLFCFSGGPIQ